MTDIGRRQEAPPPVNLDDIEVSNFQVAVAAVRILADRARSRLGSMVEAIRRRVFSGRASSHAEYGESRSEISAFLASCHRIFWALAIFSGISNLLMLNGSFFMLQVYDRVLPGRSIPTLVALLVLTTMLYLLQGGLDLVRNRISVRIGRHLDEGLGLRVYDAVVRLPLKTRGDGDGLQPLRDLDQVRSFLSGGGPTALFDLPWIPVYLAVCFLFHFWIGVTAVLGGVVLVGLTLLVEMRTRGPAKASSQHAVLRNALAAEGRRNAEVLQAMGMRRQAAQRWQDANQKYLVAHERTSDIASGLGGLSKVFRSLLQSLVLAVGAYLVINQESTAGIIIAGSILTARALAPVEIAIANWRGFVAARQSSERLDKLLKLLPAREEPLALPPPTSALVVEHLYVAAPGSERQLLSDVSFALKGGEAVGVIGPSGAGKSTLARALVGVWPQVRGKIKLDNAVLEHWTSESLGKHIGYLPQDVELFAGSVRANIARMDPAADDAKVHEAALLAHAHEMIAGLRGGYDCQIGDGGVRLSAGQRQRIGLARAVYGTPRLIVLDEPNANLDTAGESALAAALAALKAQGCALVIIGHRPSTLAQADKLMLLQDGAVEAFGPREEVLQRLRNAMANKRRVAEQQETADQPLVPMQR